MSQEFDFDNFDTFDVTVEDDVNKSVDLNADNVTDILGLASDSKRSHTQAIRHIDVDSDMYDEVYNASNIIRKSVEAGKQILPVFDNLHKDIFMSLFKYRPELVPEESMKTSTRINNRVLKELIKTDEYKALRKNCKLDLFSSAMGSEIIADKAVNVIAEWKQQVDDLIKERNKMTGQTGNPIDDMDDLKALEDEIDDLIANQQSAQQMIDEAGGTIDPNSPLQKAIDGMGMTLKEAQAKASQLQNQIDDFLDENDDLVSNLTQALSTTLQESDNSISENSDMIDAWGMGENETGASRVPFEDKRKALERIRRSPKLKDLTNLIGRFKESALTDQKRKSKDGATAIKSIKNGNKLETVLPSEKMKLCNDTTKKQFYSQYHQKELLQYELESDKTKSKGPLIVCIDTSGSMQGAREKWSKAVAIAMLEIANLQKRDYAGILFSNHAEKPIVIPKGKVEPSKVLDIAEKFDNGGTDFQSPLEEAVKLIKESKFKKADILFITDGESSVSNDFLKEFKQTKEEKDFNVMGVCINAGQGRVSTKSMETFCDSVILLDKLSDLEDANSDIAHSMFTGV